MEKTNSAVIYLNELLKRVLKRNASDLHLTRDSSGKVFVDLRVDGILEKVDPVPDSIADKLFGRIKYLAIGISG